MQYKYIIAALICQVMGLSVFGQQNTPVLSQTSASGTATTFAAPPEPINYAFPNILRTYIPLIPITDPLSISVNTTSDIAKQQFMYADGFNRPFQSITKNIAIVNGVSKSLIQVSDNRVKQDQFSYLPFPADNSNYQSTAFQQQKNYYASTFPNEGYTSFTKKQVTSNPADRSDMTLSPGKSQVGQNRGVSTKMVTNGSNEVVIWGLDANQRPVSLGYYGPTQLIGSQTLTPTGATGLETIISYKDRDGKLILKMVADSNYFFTSGLNTINKTTYKKTYYVYDDKGKARFVLPPKLVQVFEDNNTAFTNTNIDNLCFQYQYDAKGRMIASRKPGENDFTYLIYDRKDRGVMKQTPNERVNGEWEVNFYDAYGRTKATSVFVFNGNNYTQAQVQSQIDGWSGGSTSDLMYYLATIDGEKLYPSENAVYGNTIMSYTYYDNYDLSDPTGSKWNTYSTQLNFNELITTGYAETPAKSSRTDGLPTGTKVRILNSPNADVSKTGEWRTSVMFYDDKGRVIYTVGYDLSSSTAIHTTLTGTQYDFAGRNILTKHLVINKNTTDNINSHIELTKNQYESTTGNLIKTIHKVDDHDWVTLSSIVYDELGKIKRKTLGNGGEVQDYTYGIDGKPLGINGIYAETGNKQGFSKTFGESLKYDYGFQQPRYDNSLSGVVWRGSSATNMYAYGYDYTQDALLKRADFTSYNGTAWSNSSIDYSVSNLFYDKNGNINSMNQKGVSPTGVVDMDILGYTYENSGLSNRLKDVVDHGVADYGAGDFQDKNAANDFGYDDNGNLISDKNKGISAARYTRFDKVVFLNIEMDISKGTIEYSYDAGENKVQELIMDNNSGQNQTTDYLGNFVYKNDQLQYIQTAEGRTVIDNSTNIPKEEYFVKDHLGNIRSIIDVNNYSLHNYLASYELASANLENLIFDNIDDIRDIRPGGIGDNTMAANLNGADSKRSIGTSLLVHVMAGDKVSMNVSTYYDSYNPSQDSPLGASTVMNAIISTLTGGIGGLGASESHNTQIVNSVFTPENYANLNSLITSQTDPSKPKAYLNYALFDENMQLVQEMSGAFQANSNGDWQQIGTNSALEIPKNGYLAVYLSNASVIANCLHCSDVYFDQLLVQISNGHLLEENHYYPHGLPISKLGSVTSDPNYEENRRKYQGNEYITSLNLNWMDFAARQYDPQIGRFLGIDPQAVKEGQDMYSPYAAMGNKPESNIDPNGQMPYDFIRQNKIIASSFAAMRSGGGEWGGGVGPASGAGGGNPDGFSVDAANAEFEHQAAINALYNAIVEQYSGQSSSSTATNGVGGIYAAYDNNNRGASNYQLSGETIGKDGWIHGQSGNIKYQYGFINDNKNTSGYTGINFEFAVGAPEGFSDLNFIQSVRTNSPAYLGTDKYNKWFNDLEPGHMENAPFFWGKENRVKQAERAASIGAGYKQLLDDSPGTSGTGINYYWQAQTTLIGKKNGVYQAILTIDWGYFLTDGRTITVGPFVTPIPTSFQQSLFPKNLKP